MALFDFFDIAALTRRVRPATPRGVMRVTAIAGALALGGLLAATPAGSQRAASPAGVKCKFAPVRQIDRDVGVEPQLLIDGTCIDPDYNQSTFVIDKTEELTYQVPDGGPLIPYTQVTGHFPAMVKAANLPAGVMQSPRTDEQDYVWRFPAKQFWQHRSFQIEHPTGHGTVDNRLAFTNGAFSMNWTAGGPVATHRHHAAAATKLAVAYAHKLYGDDQKIYSYYWGCSGGGTVAMAAAENVTGVWDGVMAQCIGTNADAQYHSFHWQGLYTMAIPQAKRDAIAAAALPGSTGDIYAGLNEEEVSILNEFLAAGYPLAAIGNHFKNLIPLVDPIDIRMFDPTYEDDFWSKPGYAGANPPNFLKAALTDGYATITGITRDAAGVPTAVQFDPATVPALTMMGQSYLEYFVYGPDGKTRVIDPVRATGGATANRRRYSLMGNLDTKTGTLTLTANSPQNPTANSPILLGALKPGAKIRVNNRFILSIYFYPRYSNVPGIRSHDQYRNADGSPKYPQRKNIGVLSHSNYRTMGGRIETGAVTTKTMVFESMGDNLSWPIFNASYAEKIQRTMGAKADDTMRFYLSDNGAHTVGGLVAGIFRQALTDLMNWAEKGIAPPPSSRYTIRNGQVVMPTEAADRHGLQPVMNFTANGGPRAVVTVNQPVNLAAKLEMPPATGLITQYNWTLGSVNDEATVLAKPLPLVNVTRTLTFTTPGTYVIRLNVNGQRDGLVNPANQTLLQNYKDVRVVVEAPPPAPAGRGGRGGAPAGGRGGGAAPPARAP